MITYEKVLEITKVNESFKMKYQDFNGTTVAQCTYFLAKPGDFFDAKKDGSMVKGTELRGITFVNENKGQGWKTYLFIEKFFNINQTNGSNITNMKLIINEKEEICNINKLFAINGDINKICRAVDLKETLEVAEYNRDTETTGKVFKINKLEKKILETEKPENSWMFNDVKHLKIERISNKEDGSAIRFLLINNDLVAKTKFSFESEQTEMAMSIVNKKGNEKLKEFILKTLDMGIVALFEIVSPWNKIVLNYSETSLKLLQLRDENNEGKYINPYTFELIKKYNIEIAKEENVNKVELVSKKYTKKEAIEILGENKFNSLDNFLNYLLKNKVKEKELNTNMLPLEIILLSSEYIEEKEGVVITFNNSKMAKIKNSWYMRLHGILSDGLKENRLIKSILEETIDDTIAIIPEKNIEERRYINDITNIIVDYVNSLSNKAYDIVEKEYKNNDKKAIAIKYKEDKLIFPYVMLLVNKGLDFELVENAVKERVIFECRKLEMAKRFLKNLGFENELKLLNTDN